MKLAGNVKQKKKLMEVLKTSRRTIQAELLSGVAALKQAMPTFHRLIDHRNHLNFDQLFGLS